MQTGWAGHYLDGRTALRRAAQIAITPHSLRIVCDDGLKAEWDLKEAVQTQGAYASEPIRLERSGEAVVVEDKRFLEALREIAPTFAERIQSESATGKKFLWIALAGVSALAIIAAIYLWGIPAAASYVAGRVPPSWEEKLGREMAKGLSESDCNDAALIKNVHEIVVKLNRAADPHPYTFNIHIAKNNAVNALALPGGHIVLFTGLLERTGRPEEAAGVIAHEMTHILRKHPTKGIFHVLSTRMLFSFVTGDFQGAASFLNTLGNLRYSRLNEDEADRGAIKLMTKAGIDPRGFENFLKKLESRHGSMPDVFVYASTHPLTKERIEAVKGITGDAAFQPIETSTPWGESVKACSSGLEQIPQSCGDPPDAPWEKEEHPLQGNVE